jgi:hypothetical protein
MVGESGRRGAVKIVVSSNCQTGGLAAALGAMLPADTVVPCPWIGDDASDVTLRAALNDADAWVTAADDVARAELLPPGRDVTVVRVPRVLFNAFHPDTIYVAGSDGAWLESPVARLHSAIVVWGWRNGLSPADIVARFVPSVMDGLGYTAAWDPAVERLRATVAPTDIDFDPFFLPLQRGEPFMLTVNHARIGALVQLARQVAPRLGARADLVEFPWETTLPDGPLARGPFWPVYPTVAGALGVRGGYVWRRPGGQYFDLEAFVEASLARYAGYEPTAVLAPALDDPRYDEVLGDALVAT